MSLVQLPDEILCSIGGYLSCYRDLRALVLSNRRLNRIFKVILITSSVKDCHGSLLFCAVQSGDICLVREILKQLLLINKKREKTGSMEEGPITNTQNNTDEEDGARDWDGTLHWDLQQHPLYKEGYRARDILLVQRAFLAAISTGLKELVNCFLDCGAVAGFAFPVNEKHPLPVSLAIRHGHDAIFDLLIKHKARTCGGVECPIVEAVKYHRFHELRALVRLGVCGHWDEALSLTLDTRPMFDLMVENGVEIKKYGHVALYGAITEGKKDWVEFLISEGADPNLCLSTESVIGDGEKKYSSIYHAILRGHLDVCKFLIEHGVQPEEDDLQLAREKEYDEIVGILSGYSYVDVPEKEDLLLGVEFGVVNVTVYNLVQDDTLLATARVMGDEIVVTHI
ncbi:ankyrin repeat protein [Aspergillus lentulus]|nr:ankyrin repeat protein [Aspergillus lentulus]